MKKRILWIAPEEKGGIRDYTEDLWPEVRRALQAHEGMDPLEPHFELDWRRLREEKPHLIHFQHEYGLFRGDLIPNYYFPAVVRKIRRMLPETLFVATAHSVRDRGYQIPIRGHALSRGVRTLLNRSLLPVLSRQWNERTWPPLDSVIVHSALQKPWIESLGQPNVHVIPHFVPDVTRFHGRRLKHRILEQIPHEAYVLMVFGFFSEDKGQDVVIEAVKALPESVHLVLAGGVRRPEDQYYWNSCRALASKSDLLGRVHFLGYVDEFEIDSLYERADLVVCPFRTTSGSGSIVQAIARKKAILASDLPINKELSERVAETLSLFSSGDPGSLVEASLSLLRDPNRILALSEGAVRYAKKFDMGSTAEETAGLYQELLG